MNLWCGCACVWMSVCRMKCLNLLFLSHSADKYTRIQTKHKCVRRKMQSSIKLHTSKKFQENYYAAFALLRGGAPEFIHFFVRCCLSVFVSLALLFNTQLLNFGFLIIRFFPYKTMFCVLSFHILHMVL